MIYNNGELPKGWTVDTLKQKHTSEPANPDIAKVFFRAGYIESWGRGTVKIVEQCMNAGIPEPVFEDKWGGLAIIFKVKSSENNSKKGSEKSSEKIIEQIKINKNVTIPQLAKIIGLSTRAVEKQLSKLQEEGKLRRAGSRKVGYWDIL